MAEHRCVALLRAVNVGGRNRLANSMLVDVALAAGCASARAIKQSGNLVVRVAGSPDQFAAALVSGLRERSGLQVDVLARTAEQWDDILASDPWRTPPTIDPALRLAMVLDRTPRTDGIEALLRRGKGGERLHVIGRTAYLAFPGGIGRSVLTTTAIETCLMVTGTARNMRTVEAIGAALAAA